MRLHKRHQGERIDVWISPAPDAGAADLARELGQRFHLIVVPKTGTRRADVAILCDPPPFEVSRVRHILGGVPVLATTRSEPSSELGRELRRAGARVLVEPSAAELADAVERLYAAR
jgi:hypothetical protein